MDFQAIKKSSKRDFGVPDVSRTKPLSKKIKKRKSRLIPDICEPKLIPSAQKFRPQPSASRGLHNAQDRRATTPTTSPSIHKPTMNLGSSNGMFTPRHPPKARRSEPAQSILGRGRPLVSPSKFTGKRNATMSDLDSQLEVRKRARGNEISTEPMGALERVQNAVSPISTDEQATSPPLASPDGEVGKGIPTGSLDGEDIYYPELDDFEYHLRAITWSDPKCYVPTGPANNSALDQESMLFQSPWESLNLSGGSKVDYHSDPLDEVDRKPNSAAADNEDGSLPLWLYNIIRLPEAFPELPMALQHTETELDIDTVSWAMRAVYGSVDRPNRSLPTDALLAQAPQSSVKATGSPSISVGCTSRKTLGTPCADTPSVPVLLDIPSSAAPRVTTRPRTAYTNSTPQAPGVPTRTVNYESNFLAHSSTSLTAPSVAASTRGLLAAQAATGSVIPKSSTYTSATVRSNIRGISVACATARRLRAGATQQVVEQPIASTSSAIVNRFRFTLEQEEEIWDLCNAKNHRQAYRKFPRHESYTLVSGNEAIREYAAETPGMVTEKAVVKDQMWVCQSTAYWGRDGAVAYRATPCGQGCGSLNILENHIDVKYFSKILGKYPRKEK